MILKNNLYLVYILIGSFIFLTVYALEANGQENRGASYLVLEFMHVDNEQETAYGETESFWRNIHQERVNAGDIIGWDLWWLRPGGENQGAQYLTVTIYDDPVEMMQGGNFMEHARNAYPDMSDEELMAELDKGASTRDLASRYYMARVGGVGSDYELEIGTVSSMDMMKVEFDNMTSYDIYEQTEMDVFMPWHEEAIQNGTKESWGLYRVMSPIGNATGFSHITFNMYNGWEQYFSGGMGGDSFSDDLLIERGLQTRTMEWSYLATLIDMVR
ncbi:hypothetical protein [Rhodohalobacter mucosus]|uniref:NIPSNAP protein n=1 Tax=Rhodohalobacter mucosus TaxID=2079485 RepID=A0A316TUJ3_9BACT|nr:hypothetical protein [Rhodohalobacter mucosus]PWN08173.1 hypothetical protein DDZ15_00625 [Rhodohalobacter mucosus]